MSVVIPIHGHIDFNEYKLRCELRGHDDDALQQFVSYLRSNFADKVCTWEDRRSWGKYPFGDYIAYNNAPFTLTEVKRLWRQKSCLKKYGKRLVMRLDDFEKPTKTNVLCSNWKKWEEPIIWFQGITDAVAAQFFHTNSSISFCPRDSVHPFISMAIMQQCISIFGLPLGY
ncbi:unnamed protein product [Microthlaspi erraticum]|uniref:Uncharacterized protein n=1 Tax=Microthlaspi erraticum TaxID=1685480 RepID=A0A6D2IA03_9BRAS|nr:unnamed protein product [Microthlaspi erraticum]